MKFACIADLHLHPHREFGRTVQLELFGDLYTLNSRLVDQIVTLNDLFDRLHQRGIKNLFIAGDLFHVRGTIPADVLQIAIALFSHWKEQGMAFVAISGNHDQMDIAGGIHSTAAFYNLFDLIVSGVNPISMKLKGTNTWVHLLSWVEDRNLFKEQLDRFQPRGVEGGYDVLITHAAIDGAAIGTMEYRLKEPVFVDDLNPANFDAVFMGHFHKPQKMADNVWYVGSPYQLTRAEMGDAKRAMIFDTETGKVTFLKTNFKPFIMMSYEDLVEGDICVQDGYYDVVVCDRIGTDGARYRPDPVEVRERMAELHVTDFHIIHPRAEASTKSRMKTRKRATDQDILEAFLTAKGVEPHPKLVEAGLECLQGTSMHGAQAKEISFESIRVRNFLSLRKADLQLHNPGSVIAVLGENLDASGMESNGAGKSSLLPEALVWCLYGSTIRDIPVDRVVNSTKKRNCMVRLKAMVDGLAIQVTRYRKHEEHGNSLTLVVDGVDQTQGTNALTQAKLDSLIGMSLEAFNSIMAFSPDTLHFVSAPDASKKQILDSILHTERYTQAMQAAKVKRTEATEAMQKAAQEMAETSGRMTSKAEQIQEYKRLQAEDKQRLNELRKAREAKIKQLNKDLQTDLKSLEDLDASIEVAVKDLAKSQAKLPNLDNLHEAKDKTSDSLKAVEKQIVEIGVKQGQITASISKMTKAVGKECPTCHQAISGAHVGKLSAKLDRQNQELAAQLEPLTVQERNLQEAIARFNLDIRKAAETTNEINEKRRFKDGLGHQKAQLEQTISRTRRDIKELETTADYGPDYATLIKDAQDEMDDLESTRKSAEKQIKKMNRKKDTYANWVDWFGHKGIKSYLLDAVVPALTCYANEFAEELTDGGISIEFTTDNDKFTIIAHNSEGADVYGGNSSGERRRIDICVMFALFRLANEQTNINVLLLDEVFDCMDTTGLERIVTLIHNLAHNLELTIFVTSHTDLRKWLHESIIVSKQNRMAVLKA